MKSDIFYTASLRAKEQGIELMDLPLPESEKEKFNKLFAIMEQVIREDERKKCAQICRDEGAYKEDIDTYYECADAILRITDTSSLSDLK